MARDLILAIDAGTSVIKVLAFDLDGNEVATAARPNTYRSGPGGAVDQDMARTWRDAAETLRMLGDKVPRLAERAIAIAVTGQGDGMWLVDKEGEPVAPAWLWLDARSAAIAEDFVKSPAHVEHYKRTGTGVNACQMSTQLVWMQRHRPEVLTRAATSFHCKDWLYFRLTGERVTEPSESTFTFGDFRTRRYSEEVIGALGLSDVSLQIGGAVVLMLVALRMVFPTGQGVYGDQPHGEPFIVPLAVPALAGPSALATVLLFAVTRVIYIPQGEYVAFGALTLARPRKCGRWQTQGPWKRVGEDDRQVEQVSRNGLGFVRLSGCEPRQEQHGADQRQEERGRQSVDPGQHFAADAGSP